MTLDDHIEQWLNENHKDREKGKYWATDIYRIKKGELTPANFYEPHVLDAKAIGNVARGIAGENFITDCLRARKASFEPQARFEIKIAKGIILSGKPDYLFKDKIIEAKAPTRQLEGIPPWYLDQCESYFRAYNLPVFLLELRFYPFSTKLHKFEPDNERWEETKRVLKKFHKELK